MANAAITSTPVIATATKAMVCPSFRLASGARFPGGFISILICGDRVCLYQSGSRVVGAGNEKLDHAAELPLVRILDANVGRDLLHRRGSSWVGAQYQAAID